MISQANISANTPMAANLVPGGGATFRAWAPLSSAVYINGTFGGSAMTGQTDNLLLAKDANSYWAGFVASAQEGDPSWAPLALAPSATHTRASCRPLRRQPQRGWQGTRPSSLGVHPPSVRDRRRIPVLRLRPARRRRQSGWL
jgi:hypothetical protein